ncbi:MAG TPA: DUF488 domain-containing protein [Allosphingosinicella sp.]
MSEAAGFPIYTVGHSTRSIDEFIDLLRAGRVGRVADIRTVPKSRRNPQYGGDVLGDALHGRQIGYVRIARLGGLRGPSPGVPPETNALWRNGSFHNYADYALGPEFEAGLDELLRLADERPTAMMCAEAVWWRCHRRIVADHLLARGREVLHLMDDRITAATMTPGVQVANGKVTYPAPDQGIGT